MATNKERIELLEQGFGGLQDSMQQMDIGVADNFSLEGASQTNREGGDYNKPFSSKTARLEFLRFSGEDPT